MGVAHGNHTVAVAHHAGYGLSGDDGHPDLPAAVAVALQDHALAVDVYLVVLPHAQAKVLAGRLEDQRPIGGGTFSVAPQSST